MESWEQGMREAGIHLRAVLPYSTPLTHSSFPLLPLLHIEMSTHLDTLSGYVDCYLHRDTRMKVELGCMS